MDGVALRAVTDEELDDFVAVTDRSFGFVPALVHVELERRVVELDRTIGAFVDDELLATAAAFSFELTLPGPLLGPADALPTVPVAGVTGVAVTSTHRRRGILRSMMVRQLRDVAERGEPAAVLIASEAPIYQRFGYGVASEHESLRLDVTRAATVVAPPARALRLVPQHQAAPLLAPVHERARRRRPGMLARSDRWWECVLSEVPTWKGPGACWVVVASDEPGGEPLGYALHRIQQRGRPGDWTVVVDELEAVDDGTEAALWAHLSSVDLVGTLEAPTRPVDEPHRWRLADPRRLEATFRTDFLWLRPVDVVALLSARGYAGGGRVVLEVDDAFARSVAAETGAPVPFDVAGTYLLEVDGDGTARCAPAPGARPDLVGTAADVGATSLGGTSWSALVAAGRVREATPHAAARADALFASPRAPFCSTRF